jgi:uncharacterized membrane protein
MTRKMWLWSALLAMPLAAGGLVYANSQTQQQSYVCPLTGETLPCEKCCPMNKQGNDQSYVCPLTGEQLPCEKCCPLNEGK